MSHLHRFEHGSRPESLRTPVIDTQREIQNPPQLYGIIDLRELSSLCGFGHVATFQQAHRRWVDDSLAHEAMAREGRWSEAIAVGNLNFVEKVQNELGYKAAHREVIESGGTYELREQNEIMGPILAVKMRC